ncbi:hypothetical protein RHSIM_Rhsim05G0005500 [Rhododendron simsii]|uniref:Uncharacterized protein n=1 Tax=Rhododendron simsii TaxID=118357 RepID=A0A834GW25_RHOSS|nr:hypothetical protein RHSIM_Rhsim05G0005500 [Rhododendron simsii]
MGNSKLRLALSSTNPTLARPPPFPHRPYPFFPVRARVLSENHRPEKSYQNHFVIVESCAIATEDFNAPRPIDNRGGGVQMLQAPIDGCVWNSNYELSALAALLINGTNCSIMDAPVVSRSDTTTATAAAGCVLSNTSLSQSLLPFRYSFAIVVVVAITDRKSRMQLQSLSLESSDSSGFNQRVEMEQSVGLDRVTKIAAISIRKDMGALLKMETLGIRSEDI